MSFQALINQVSGFFSLMSDIISLIPAEILLIGTVTFSLFVLFGILHLWREH